MIRFLIFLLGVAATAYGLSWVADQPGTITIEWLGHRVDTSVIVIVSALLVAILLLVFLVNLVAHIVSAPARFRTQSQLKHTKQGLEHITRSVALLAANDPKAALTHTNKAQRVLGKGPLTLMLTAQAERNRGNIKQAQNILTELLDYKETEFLAARSLSDTAQKEGQYKEALQLAERACTLTSQDVQSQNTLVSLYIRNKRWQEALTAIKKSPRAAYDSFKQRKRHQGLVHLAYAQELMDGERYEEAATQASQTIQHLGYFTPAALIAAHAYHKIGSTKKAISILRKSWHEAANGKLIQAMRHITAEFPAEKQQRYLMPMLQHSDSSAVDWKCTECGHQEADWFIFCPECNSFDTLSHIA